MKAQELRIGNIVECFGTREVVAIKNNKIKVQHESNKGHFIIEWGPIDSLSLKPIPLTEEWLLKFGVDYTSEDDYYYITFTIKGLFFESASSFNGFVYDILLDTAIIIKYVHQLQNIYFALTGEELTIKEN